MAKYLIDFESLESHVFSNPSMAAALPKPMASHIWLATSGTSRKEGEMKWCALSKKALLVSAEAVNQHIDAISRDIWVNPLPIFHVGSLAIYARAYLKSSKVIALPKWSPGEFVKAIDLEQATLSSLVPTQVFDLVKNRYKAPTPLRTLFIGGGSLSDELYAEAKKLNWPLLPSYGSTECSSQVATASLLDKRLKVLPHVTCAISSEGTLRIQSDALLTGYLMIKDGIESWHDPKECGWLTTDDQVDLDQGFLKFIGRKSDFIKISGENVSFFALQQKWERIKPATFDAVLIKKPDPRLGYQIELMTLHEHQDDLLGYIEKFNAEVMPYARIKQINPVDAIPRNTMGKLVSLNT